MEISADYLEFEELAIECQIRNIGGPLSKRLDKLQRYISKELNDELEPPTEAHASAAKNAKREVQSCGMKIKKIEKNILELTGKPGEIIGNYVPSLETTLWHVRGRLERISHLRSVVAIVPKYLETVSNLDTCVKELKEKLEVTAQVETSLKEALQSLSDFQSSNSNTSEVDLNQDTGAVSNVPGTSDTIPRQSTQDNWVPPQHTILGESEDVINHICVTLFEKLKVPLTESILQTLVNNKALLKQENVSRSLENLQESKVQLGSVSSLHNRNNGDANIDYSNIKLANRTGNAESINVKESKNGKEFQGRARDTLRMYEWNLCFYGDDKDKVSIENFLYRVENMATANNVSIERLTKNFPVLLKEQALNWYWNLSQSDDALSWSTLKTNMIRRFRVRRADADIRYELERTRQKFKESFFDFYDGLQNKALKLQTPLTELETINLLMRNMRPGLQDKFAGKRFTELTSFVDMCVLVEDDWQRMGYVPEMYMAKRNVNEINVENVYTEDDLVDQYVNQAQNFSVDAFNKNNKSVASASPSAHFFSKPNKSTITCWNCKQPGHPFPECPSEERNLFCYGCGAPGILKPDCPYCGRKENQYRESRKTGVLNSQTLMLKPSTVTTEAASNTDPDFYRMSRRQTRDLQALEPAAQEKSN